MHFRYFIVEILFTANKLLLVLVAYIKITIRKLKIFSVIQDSCVHTHESGFPFSFAILQN